MGWIKARLDDDTHDALRRVVADSDDPTHEVVGAMLRERLNGGDGE